MAGGVPVWLHLGLPPDVDPILTSGPVMLRKGWPPEPAKNAVSWPHEPANQQPDLPCRYFAANFSTFRQAGRQAGQRQAGQRQCYRCSMSTLKGIIVATLAAAALAACASTIEEASSDNDDGGGDGAGNGDQGGDPNFGGDDGGDGLLLDAAPEDDCSDAAKLIYVVTLQNELLSFSPPTLTFKSIGKLTCTGGGTPFSMGVARDGTAWVLYSTGHIFNVSTTDATCTPTAYVPNQQGWPTFGMGFVSDSPGSQSETLYVAEYKGNGLGKIDTSSLKLSIVGPWNALTGTAELSGTSEAKLFGFWADSITVREIDKSNAATLTTYHPSVTPGSGLAFAHWGGSFWLFTAPKGSSQVDQLDPATSTTKTVKSGLGYVIVGAGVSTCAPTVMPPIK